MKKFISLCLLLLSASIGFATDKVSPTSLEIKSQFTPVLVKDQNGKPVRDKNGDLLFAAVQVDFKPFFSPGLGFSGSAGIQTRNEFLAGEAFVGTQIAFGETPQLDAGVRVRMKVYSANKFHTFAEWEGSDVVAHGDAYLSDSQVYSVVFKLKEENDGFSTKVGYGKTQCNNERAAVGTSDYSRRCGYIRIAVTKKF